MKEWAVSAWVGAALVRERCEDSAGKRRVHLPREFAFRICKRRDVKVQRNKVLIFHSNWGSNKIFVYISIGGGSR